MKDLIILKEGEGDTHELGELFLNRFMNREGFDSILIKDYPLKYKPIKVFDLTGNTQRLNLTLLEEHLKTRLEAGTPKEKWIKSVINGSLKALYRANLDDLSGGEETAEEVPSEQDILWEAILGGGEVAIIPDTSSLMDGLISRLIEKNEEESVDLHLWLSPTVIKELQRHAIGRSKKFHVKKGKKEDEELIHFAEIKRKSRLALRAMSELVELKKKKKIKIDTIEREKSDHGVPDWQIISDAKSLHVDIPKFFVSNDVIQSTLAEVMGLKTRYMYPPHLLSKGEITLEGKEEVGRALYELSIQFGEIIIKTPNLKFTIQSDWANKMSPSWVEKTVYLRINYEKNSLRDEILKIINRNRYSYEKVDDFDPRINSIL
jgi:hypothetical protein